MLIDMHPALADALELSVNARLELIEVLWNSIVDEHGEVLAVTDEEREELARRLRAHEQDPAAAIPWVEVKARFGIP
jgi:putative addiction module component (TIGR02574 family)